MLCAFSAVIVCTEKNYIAMVNLQSFAYSKSGYSIIYLQASPILDQTISIINLLISNTGSMYAVSSYFEDMLSDSRIEQFAIVVN